MLRRYQDTILFFLALSLAVWAGVRQARLSALVSQSPESEQTALIFFQSDK